MKKYTVVKVRKGREEILDPMTVEELSNYFSYSLEVGASWQHEKGNKRINRKPKTIKSLITNYNNARNNAAANGYADEYIYLKENQEN